MKIREWEIVQHLSSLLEEADVFGTSPEFRLRVWIVRPGFAIHQIGDQIAVGIDGLLGRYFDPDLTKITRASIAEADRLAGIQYSFDSEYGDPDVVEKLFS